MTERFSAIADSMNSLEFMADASLHYDMLADALWWSDERPDFDNAEDLWALQGVFRFRTSIILGSPEPQYESDWSAALQSFPNWPGFHPSRRVPDEGLRRFYEERRDEALNSFRQLPD